MTDKEVISEEEFIQNFAIELTNRTLDEREEIGRKYYKFFQRLQAENEELKIELSNLKQSIENFCGCKIRDDKTGLPICENADKYKQALKEVKELAKGKIKWCEYGKRYCNKCKCICNEYKTLTIINEVLKDE